MAVPQRADGSRAVDDVAVRTALLPVPKKSYRRRNHGERERLKKQREKAERQRAVFLLYTENPAIVAGFQRAYSYAKKSPCAKIMLRSGNCNGNTRRFIK